MTVEHNTLTGASLHEPKGIDSAGTSDAGKVLTPSATTAGEGELRNLVENEINSKQEYFTAVFEDIANVGDIYIPVTFAGTITDIRSVIDGALGTSDTTLTVKINGTVMTGGVITVAFSGSAAGDVDQATTPTANNTFTTGDYVQVTSNTAGTGTVNATLMFTATRT